MALCKLLPIGMILPISGPVIATFSAHETVVAEFVLPLARRIGANVRKDPHSRSFVETN